MRHKRLRYYVPSESILETAAAATTYRSTPHARWTLPLHAAAVTGLREAHRQQARQRDMSTQKYVVMFVLVADKAARVRKPVWSHAAIFQHILVPMGMRAASMSRQFLLESTNPTCFDVFSPLSAHPALPKVRAFG